MFLGVVEHLIPKVPGGHCTAKDNVKQGFYEAERETDQGYSKASVRICLLRARNSPQALPTLERLYRLSIQPGLRITT